MGNTSGFMFARDTFRIPDSVTFVKAFRKKMIEFVRKKYGEKDREHSGTFRFRLALRNGMWYDVRSGFFPLFSDFIRREVFSDG